MILTAKIKLEPTPDQHQALKDTLYTANKACDWVSNFAWTEKAFGKFKIQYAIYDEVRDRFGLPSQMAVRAIAKVADAYKKDKRRKRTFKPLGAFPYDARNLKIWTKEQRVSISSLNGREGMTFSGGQRQLELLEGRHKEADLCYIKGTFFLFVACEVEEPSEDDVKEYLGVDLGIANIASDSDGFVYAGGTVNGLRARHTKLRRRLQKKGTRSSKRLLKKRRRKEQRFASDVNHCISKELVERAKRTGRGIAIEELTGIRDRVRVRKAQRRQHHSWSFQDLRLKIEYKARLLGVPVVAVDPRYTSQTCSKCGHCEKSNRKNQESFNCRSCGFALNADLNAARNISGRAVVNQPHATGLSFSGLSA